MPRILICVLILTLVGVFGCDKMSGPKKSGQAQISEMALTERNQQRLAQAQKAPELNDSLERRQLITRLETFNDANKISYITLLSMGRPVGYFPIKGKVSSVNSLLTTPSQVLWKSTHNGVSGITIPSPDLDGSYGSNGDAVFFYLQDGTYMEWNGEYLLSDRPVQLSIEPIIITPKD